MVMFHRLISKDTFMKAPDESGINKDCTEKSTDWNAIVGQRCTMYILVHDVNILHITKDH